MSSPPDLRVAFDHTIFVAQRYGGISRYAARLAQHLPAQGIDTRVIAPMYLNAYLPSLGGGIVLGRQVAPTLRNERIAKLVDFALHRPLALATHSDIVHETYFRTKRLAPPKARVVLTVYDMIHELMPDSVGPKDHTRRNKAAALERADAILCISESTKRDLISIYPETEGRAFVTLLGFDAADAHAGAATQPWLGKPYILYVGGRGGYKNFATLLAAYAASPGLKAEFDLLCVGGSSFAEEEHAAFARLGVAGRIHHEHAGDALLYRRYRDAAVFVYPSRYEGFGIPPLEAMASNCPVVTMKVSSIPEVCGDAADYAEADDAEALGAAIARVVGDPAHADALRAAGRARLALFSWGKCAAETAAVYRSLA